AVTKKKPDIYTRTWITENAIEIISDYGAGELTIRALHYKLVGRSMPNTFQHYKRVIGAMIEARWDGRVDFTAFSDHERELMGKTRSEATDVEESIDDAKSAIGNWMKYYFK